MTAPPASSDRATEPLDPAWVDAAPPEPEHAIVGRDDLVAELVNVLVSGEDRAIVLSGIGGVGKTRLAIEIAGHVGAAFGGRVAWVALGGLPRNAGLAAAIGTALRIDDGEPDHLVDAIVATVGDEPALVVVDAIEAVLHDLAVVEELVAVQPALRVVLTSRVALGREGVRSVAVGPLAVPRPGAEPEAIVESPAVALLLERAEAAGAGLAITPTSLPVIGRLVSQLDGLPLAIELVAPLLRLLPPHRLLERVREGLDPIDATIGWAHDQLSPEDRRLYRRIAVFGVPFRVRHVRTFDERSVAHGLQALGPDVGAGLERLVAAGLLRGRSDTTEQDEASGPDDPRGPDVREYDLPSLMRDDALRRLEASGEATAAMWARANDLLALCELVDAELAIRTRRDLLDQLDTVHDDLLAALTRARAAGEGRFLLRLTSALAEYWRARGRLAEGRIWLDTALRLGPTEPSVERARALHGAGILANWQSDFGRARTVLQEALEMRLQLGLRAEAAASLNQLGLIALDQGDLEVAEQFCRLGLEMRRELGDEAALAGSLNTLGGVLHYQGRVDGAHELFEEALAIRRRLGDSAGESVALGNLGLVARDAGDLVGAEAMLREALATRERLGDRQRIAVIRHNLALVLFDAGDVDGARAELEAAIAVARELGDRLELSNALSDRGFVETSAGNIDRAAALQDEALVIAARIGAKGIVAQAIDGSARIAELRGDRATAATLWAAAQRIRRDARYAMLASDRRRVEAETHAAKAAAPPEEWDAACSLGASLTMDEAIARTRAALGSDADPITSRAIGKVAV